MGFFDSKKTTESSSTYDNPELRQYTQSYRGASPWAFASLDPTATLAAMRRGADIGGLGMGTKAGKDFKKHLEGLSADEKKQQTDTDSALERIRTRQESGQFLTPQETEFINTSLDKAFEFSRTAAVADWTKATQMMAGSRGMRMSDTPVAEPALRELRNIEVGMASKRAELGLSATMDMSKNQQLFDANFAQFNQQLAQNRWATRQGFLFGGGGQMASQLGYKSTSKNTSTTGMSGFGKVMAGLSMAGGVLDLGKKVGGMAMAGGMGGAAAPGAGGWGGMLGMESNPYQ